MGEVFVYSLPGAAYIKKMTVTSAKPQRVQFKQFDSKQKRCLNFIKQKHSVLLINYQSR